ncbi:hypothetical protein BST61_g9309 [Cercospora zeina]
MAGSNTSLKPLPCNTSLPTRVSLCRRWEHRSKESKQRLLKQLREYVEEMRSLRPTREVGVEGVDGCKLYDIRISGSFSQGQQLELNELVERHTKARYHLRFTHGDLNSMSILVNGYDIVSIDDWDTCGWYPEY